MHRLLTIEWMKLKSYNAFYVVIISFVVGAIAVNYMVYYIASNITDKNPMTSAVIGLPYAFPQVWANVSFYTGLILMLPALLLTMLVTNEFTYRTHRQNIIDGLDRLDFLHAKIMVGIVIALGSTILIILVALIFGFSIGNTFSSEGIENIFYFFLKAVTYNFVAILFGLLIRKTGIALAVFLIYMAFENGVTAFLNAKAVTLKTEGGIDIGYPGDFFPLNTADGLITSPWTRATKALSNMAPTSHNLLALCLAIVYIFIFYWWSRNRMLKTDL